MSSERLEHTVEPGEAEELSHHPDPKQYVIVAVVLAVVTAAEVAIYYVSALEDFLVPMLIGFSLIKFILVVMWFMHLRFDSKLFRRLFVTGIVLALAIFTIVLVFFSTQGGPAPGAS
jgi:cytochrome c oxidase subunit 4